MRSNDLLYTLEDDGTETRYSGDSKNVSKKVKKIDLDAFWKKWQPTLAQIVAEKVEGWDQIRMFAPITCQPIWDFVVHEKNGGSRSFGIYGRPVAGGRLEDNKGTLAKHYADLYEYMTKS